MTESGFDIDVQTIDVDESYLAHLQVDEIAEFIAEKKANAYRDLLGACKIGLVADTIVALDGEILEKPVDRNDAIAMLNKMSGTNHTVYTGVCIFDKERLISFTGSSEVYFLDLSAKEIEYYVDNYEPYDKAGSYGIQEWIGFAKIEKIEGSYSNIMGLPMEMVYAKLMNFTGTIS